MVIDAPLATALIKTLPAQLRNRVAKLETGAFRKMKIVAARQVAWMILDWSKTDIHKSTFSRLEAINGLGWKGDSPAQMENCLQDWDYLIDNLGPDTMSAAAQRGMSHSNGQGQMCP